MTEHKLEYYKCGRCGRFHRPLDDRPEACATQRWRGEWLDTAFPGWQQVNDPDDEQEQLPTVRMMKATRWQERM